MKMCCLKVSALSVVMLLLVNSSIAQEGVINLNQPTNEDTTITIKKGPLVNESRSTTAYEIVAGTDEIASDEEYDEKRALAGWKEACADWKKEIKDINRDNQILSVNCGSKEKVKDGNKVLFKSQATYKMRVKVVEVRNP